MAIPIHSIIELALVKIPMQLLQVCTPLQCLGRELLAHVSLIFEPFINKVDDWELQNGYFQQDSATAYGISAAIF
jgi:hypothetical protein